MIDQIVALMAAPLAPVPAAPPPSTIVMERFNAIMNAAPSPQSSSESLQPALQTAFSVPAEVSQQTLGNQILANLQSYSTEYGEKWRSVAGRLDSLAEHASTVEALRLQSELLQIGVHNELVGKLLSRSTQNVDTLVRMS